MFSDEVIWPTALCTRRSQQSQRLFRVSMTCLQVSFGLLQSRSSLLQIKMIPAASTYAGLFSVFRMQGTGKSSRIHLSPFHLSLPGWAACHTGTANRDNSSLQLLQCLPHTALQCHLQTRPRHPYHTLTEKPIPPAAASQTQTAAAHGDGEPKTPPSFSDKLCSLT